MRSGPRAPPCSFHSCLTLSRQPDACTYHIPKHSSSDNTIPPTSLRLPVSISLLSSLLLHFLIGRVLCHLRSFRNTTPTSWATSTLPVLSCTLTTIGLLNVDKSRGFWFRTLSRDTGLKVRRMRPSCRNTNKPIAFTFGCYPSPSRHLRSARRM